MVEEEEVGDRKRANGSESTTDRTGKRTPDKARAITGILDERIENLREAIEEIDEALAGRRSLSQQFLDQIDREAEEVKRHLNTASAALEDGLPPGDRVPAPQPPQEPHQPGQGPPGGGTQVLGERRQPGQGKAQVLR